MLKHTFHLFNRVQKHYLLAAFFIIISLAVFFPVVYGRPIWDDWVFIFRNDYFYSQPFWSYFPGGSHSRSWPLFFVTMKVFLRLFGENYLLYHLSSLVLHGLNSFLCWKILSKLKLKHALWVALLFCVHPLHLLTVGWIIQFKTILSLFFFLLTLYQLLRFKETSLSRHLILSFVFYIFSLFSKSTTVGFLVLIPFFYPVLKEKYGTKTILKVFIPFLAIGLFALVRTLWSFHLAELFPEFISRMDGIQINSSISPSAYNIWTWPERAHLTIKLLIQYLLFLVWPVDNYIFHPRVSVNYTSTEFLMVVGCLILILSMAVRIFRKNNLLLKCSLVFFLVSLLPFCGFFWIPIFSYSNFVQYWLSIPVLGLLPIIASLKLRKKFLMAAVLILALVAHTQSYSLETSEKTLLCSIKRSPQEAVYYVALIEHYVHSGYCVEASENYQRLLQLSRNAELGVLAKVQRCIQDPGRLHPARE